VPAPGFVLPAPDLPVPPPPRPTEPGCGFEAPVPSGGTLLALQPGSVAAAIAPLPVFCCPAAPDSADYRIRFTISLPVLATRARWHMVAQTQSGQTGRTEELILGGNIDECQQGRRRVDAGFPRPRADCRRSWFQTAGWCRRRRWRFICASAWRNGLSVFWLPLSRAIGIQKSVACAGMTLGDALTTTSCDWRVSDVTYVFTLAIVVLGVSAALWGGWLERVGPRRAGVVSALCWSGGWRSARSACGCIIMAAAARRRPDRRRRPRSATSRRFRR